MEKTKVLFLSESATLGGAPKVMLDLVRHINRGRFEPSVMLGGIGPAVAEFSKVAPTYVFPYHVVISKTGRLQGLLRRLTERVWFRYVVSQVQPDIIYHNTVGGTQWMKYAFALALPRIMHVHGIHAPHMAQGDWFASWVAQFADHYICVAESVAHVLCSCLGVDAGKVSTIYAGVDVQGILDSCAADPVDRRVELGIRPDDFVVGGMGGLVFTKGADLFVEAAALLKQRRPRTSIKFVWVGGVNPTHTHYAKSVMARAQELGLADSIQFIGHTSQPYGYMSAFDILAMCSREEAFPLVCMEAMTLCKPVVAFDEGGLSEMLRNGAGSLVSPIVPETLADAIDRLVGDPVARKELSETGFRTVCEHFDIARNVSKFEEVIASVL